MQALLLMLTIAAQTAVPLPADSFARSNDDLVLRAGPSDSHAGVLTVPGGTIVRAASEGTGTYQRVHLAAGFPVYLHSDYVSVDAAQQTATVLGQRVNARLLPCTAGLLPVGRVGADAGALVLLDVEGVWVRVLAPVELSLWGTRAELAAVSDGAASADWERSWQSREADRRAKVSDALAADPTWLAQHDAELELSFEARVDVSALNDAKLSFRSRELGKLGARLNAQGPARNTWQLLVDGVAAEQRRRRDVLASHAAAMAARSLLDQNLEVEARALALGLSYQGQGQTQRIEGLIKRLTSADADGAVFAISDGVQEFKLSAPAGVARLPTLEGRKVTLEGRSLLLMNVDGPVLIIDRVVESGS